MRPTPDQVPPTLPLVVQVGFAGSRFLYGAHRTPPQATAALDDALLPQLMKRLDELPLRLGLTSQHFLCGVSQMAIGADMLFARALQARALPHRVLLPQATQAFLSAGDAAGPDFTPDEQTAARGLLAAQQVIEVRVVSDADDRAEQFQDANDEILRESDVILCLTREGACARPGGTRELMQHAERAGKAVMLLEVSLLDGQPVLSTWREPVLPAQAFMAPSMPAELAELALPPPSAGRLPAATDYIESVRSFASATTRRHSGGFKRAAVLIIVLHIVATLLAAIALKLDRAAWVALLLGIELVLLASGLGVHHALHRSAALRAWAVTRLLAETLRSLSSVSRTAVPLDYPLTLAYPASFRSVLRTAAVLHGLNVRRMAPDAWVAQKDAYLDQRLTGTHGQLRYFTDAAAAAGWRYRLAHSGFWAFSVAAFVATSAKLASVGGLLPAPLGPWAVSWGGLLAITLPVAAVGFLSWAAASDLEARSATYGEMSAFLTRQVARVRQASTPRNFARAVRETELGVLAENLEWFSRRLFRGVS